MHQLVLRQLRLHNFKAFETYTVNLSRNSLLVGPNNAGKSTLLSAVRTCARLLQHAQRVTPNAQKEDNGRRVLAYEFAGERFGLVEENLAHEFRDVETRLVATFWDWSRMTVVWPRPSELGGSRESFFYLEVYGRSQPRRPKDVTEHLPTLGVVPLLSPIERDESMLTEKYVRQHLDSRRASLHLRNQLWLLKEGRLGDDCDYEEFEAFLETWLPELDLTLLRPNPSVDGPKLDLFYLEEGSPVEKEIFWSGDGMQVWLQALLHLYRLRNVDSVVLDEPDVYLHADLQRRLVRLLETIEAQSITATHSAEMVAEASADSLIWVDKSRSHGMRTRGESGAGTIGQSLGSHFNLRLARALRARTVLFVEGQDMRILRSFAEAVGAENLAAERGVAVVPLGGATNWHHVEPFRWFVDDFLEGTIETFVILDRDYGSHAWAQDLVRELGQLGIRGHVWKRKELENYLLSPSLLARTAEIDIEEARTLIDAEVESLRSKVQARVTSAYLESASGSGTASTTVIERATEEFERRWADRRSRLAMVPGKDVLSSINRALEKRGAKTPSVRALAADLGPADVSDEVRSLLLQIERTLG